jgi:hypothetical protein
MGVFDNRFRRESMNACRATIGETHAWINFEITESLHEREERDWARFGQIRHQREKKFQDPPRLKRKSPAKKGGR